MDHFIVFTIKNNKTYYYVITKKNGTVVWDSDVKESKKFETKGGAEMYATNHGVRNFNVKKGF